MLFKIIYLFIIMIIFIFLKSQIIYSSLRVDTVLNSNKVHSGGKLAQNCKSISVTIRLSMLYLFKLDVHFLLLTMLEKALFRPYMRTLSSYTQRHIKISPFGYSMLRTVHSFFQIYGTPFCFSFQL